jgi:hypothetical protein
MAIDTSSWAAVTTLVVDAAAAALAAAIVEPKSDKLDAAEASICGAALTNDTLNLRLKETGQAGTEVAVERSAGPELIAPQRNFIWG